MTTEYKCLKCGRSTKPGQYLCKSCQRIFRESHKAHGVNTMSPGVHQMELTR